MYNFLNDYNDVCHPDILEALVNANNNLMDGYGNDEMTASASEAIKKLLKDDSVDIHLVPGGTSANIVSVTAGLRPEESILAATTGHIQGSEAGAIEATGTKIETIDTLDGKLTVELLEPKLNSFGADSMTVPKTVYISNTSELGTVYTKEDLQELYKFCKDNDLYLYIDGARMIHALASPHSNLEYSDLTSLCDIFTIGGTKNGLMYGEAVVIVNDELKRNFLNLMKQKGAMMAKGFVLGTSFYQAFKDDEFFIGLANHAYKMSELLSEGLTQKGYSLEYPHESNQVFIRVNKEEFEKISSIAKITKFGQVDEDIIIRLITTYRTTEESINNFLNEL